MVIFWRGGDGIARALRDGAALAPAHLHGVPVALHTAGNARRARSCVRNVRRGCSSRSVACGTVTQASCLEPLARLVLMRALRGQLAEGNQPGRDLELRSRPPSPMQSRLLATSGSDAAKKLSPPRRREALAGRTLPNWQMRTQKPQRIFRWRSRRCSRRASLRSPPPMPPKGPTAPLPLPRSPPPLPLPLLQPRQPGSSQQTDRQLRGRRVTCCVCQVLFVSRVERYYHGRCGTGGVTVCGARTREF